MGPKTNELTARLPVGKPLPVRACFLGERLNLRGLPEPAVTLGPLTVSAGEAGLAVLFRYGAVVLLNLSEAEQKIFLKDLRPRVENRRRMETEDAQLYVVGKQPEGVTPEGIGIADLALARLQIVAIALARSVALAYYENAMASAFDLIEPPARRLENPRGGGRRLRELLRHIGGTLLVLHKMTGRVEIQDKPDLLWDHPEVERLYLHLEMNMNCASATPCSSASSPHQPDRRDGGEPDAEPQHAARGMVHRGPHCVRSTAIHLRALVPALTTPSDGIILIA
jgi:hypothetical protein